MVVRLLCVLHWREISEDVFVKLTSVTFLVWTESGRFFWGFFDNESNPNICPVHFSLRLGTKGAAAGYWSRVWG